MVLPPRDEPVAAAGEAVDVEHFAVRTAARVLEADPDDAAPEHDSIPSERGKEAEPMPADAIDVGPRPDRRRCPEHECGLPMSAVAEPTALNPGQLVAAHCSADPSIGCDVRRRRRGGNERHPPSRTLESTLSPSPALQIDDEPVGTGWGPADRTTLNGLEDWERNCRRARCPGDGETQCKNSSDAQPSIDPGLA